LENKKENVREIYYICIVLLNGVAGIQKEMRQTIVSTYANELLLVGIFFCTYENITGT